MLDAPLPDTELDDPLRQDDADAVVAAALAELEDLNDLEELDDDADRDEDDVDGEDLDDGDDPALYDEIRAVREPATDEGPDLSHDWVVAANIPASPKIARAAKERTYMIIREKRRVRALDVYCELCHLPMDQAGDECAAKAEDKTGKEHLIGGDQRHRKKRTPKIDLPPGVLEAGPPLQRRGIEALVLGP